MSKLSDLTMSAMKTPVTSNSGETNTIYSAKESDNDKSKTLTSMGKKVKGALRAVHVMKKKKGKNHKLQPTVPTVGSAIIEMYKHKKKIGKMRTEFMIYLLFIGVFFTIVFMTRNVNQAYYYELSLRDIILEEKIPDTKFETFFDIGNIGDFWDWIEGPFIEGILPNTSSSGAPLPPEDLGYVLNYDYLVGYPKIRQLRVKEELCDLWINEIPIHLDNGTEEYLRVDCYLKYGSSQKSREPFGPGGKWVYTSEDSPRQWGSMYFYEASGFNVFLSRDREQAMVDLEELRTEGFIDKQTRAIIISLLFFNPNVGLFSSFRILVELTDTGATIGSFNVRTFPSSIYDSGTEIFRAILEVGWFVAFCVLLFYEGKTFWGLYKKKHSLLYWISHPWWNFVDLVNSIFFIVTMVQYIRFISNVHDLKYNSRFNPFAPVESEYFATNSILIDLENLGENWVELFNITSVNILISVFKIFKYFQLNDRMMLLWTTLSVASKDLFAFLLFFFVVFLAFVTTGYLLFGAEVATFRSFYQSIFSCFRFVLGDFSFDAMSDANRLLGPIYILLFVIVVFFILLNMFLAIINDNYAVAHAKAEKSPPISDVITHQSRKMKKQLLRAMDKVLLASNCRQTPMIKYKKKTSSEKQDEIRNLIQEEGDLLQVNKSNLETFKKMIGDPPDHKLAKYLRFLRERGVVDLTLEEFNDNEELDEREEMRQNIKKVDRNVTLLMELQDRAAVERKKEQLHTSEVVRRRNRAHSRATPRLSTIIHNRLTDIIVSGQAEKEQEEKKAEAEAKKVTDKDLGKDV